MEWINKVCCVDCGVKYLTEKQKEEPSAVTANEGICCICGKKTMVVDIRHYNYLNPPIEGIGKYNKLKSK